MKRFDNGNQRAVFKRNGIQKSNLMKRLILIMLVVPLAVKAQFTKGDLFLGGSLGVNTVDFPGADYAKNISNSFSVGPKIGYFINEKWAIGGSVGYSYSNQVLDYSVTPYYSNSRSTSRTFSANVLARRYFAITDKFLFTLEGSLGFSRSNTTNSYATSQVSTGGPEPYDDNAPAYTLSATVRPLFVFFPTPHWGIEAGLGTLSFSHQHSLSDNSSVNTFNLFVATSTSLGVYYYFRRK
jgi:hypothetical protein